MSSRKLHAGTNRGEDGSAIETRLCFTVPTGPLVDTGNGAVNENVEVDGRPIFEVKSLC